jgi:protein-tyrosine kinase
MIGLRKRGKAPPQDTVRVTETSSIAPVGSDTAGSYVMSPSLIALIRPHSPAGEAFHRLAGEVIHHHLERGRRGLALCGASSGTGVTFTSTNLAVALSQLGVPTLLIEANLRAPGVDALIKPLADRPGLQSLLRLGSDPGDAIHHEVLPNLSLLYAGGVADDANQLVACARFREVLRDCMRTYGCTLVDTPPANQSADARTIAATVGYAAVVGRHGFTYLDDASLLSGQLVQDGVKVVGSVFNGAV